MKVPPFLFFNVLKKKCQLSLPVVLFINATWGTPGGNVCTSSVTRCTTCKEEPGVAVSTFDGGWGTRLWQDVDGGT